MSQTSFYLVLVDILQLRPCFGEENVRAPGEREQLLNWISAANERRKWTHMADESHPLDVPQSIQDRLILILQSFPLSPLPFLVEMLGVSRTWILKYLQEWEQHNWIRTVYSPSLGKARYHMYYLTPLGIEHFKDVYEPEDLVRYVFSSGIDLQSLVKIVGRVAYYATLYDVYSKLWDKYWKYEKKKYLALRKEEMHFGVHFQGRWDVCRGLLFSYDMLVAFSSVAEEELFSLLLVHLDDGVLNETGIRRRVEKYLLSVRKGNIPPFLVVVQDTVRLVLWGRIASDAMSHQPGATICVYLHYDFPWPLVNERYHKTYTPGWYQVVDVAINEECIKLLNSQVLFGHTSSYEQMPVVYPLWYLPEKFVSHRARKVYDKALPIGIEETIHQMRKDKRLVLVANLALTTLDIEYRYQKLIMEVALHPLIPVEDLAWREGIETRTVKNMLRKLREEGYVELVEVRLPFPLPSLLGKYCNAVTDCVRVLDRGVRLLRGIYGYQDVRLVPFWMKGTWKPRPHDVGVARLCSLLEQWYLHTKQGTIVWEVGPKTVIQYRSKGRRRKIYPDASGVKVNISTQLYIPIYLECDFGTEKEVQWYYKFLAYIAYFESRFPRIDFPTSWVRGDEYISAYLMIVCPDEKQLSRICAEFYVNVWKRLSQNVRQHTRIFIRTFEHFLSAERDAWVNMYDYCFHEERRQEIDKLVPSVSSVTYGFLQYLPEEERDIPWFVEAVEKYAGLGGDLKVSVRKSDRKDFSFSESHQELSGENYFQFVASLLSSKGSRDAQSDALYSMRELTHVVQREEVRRKALKKEI
jgi:DNA-binding Lrp family transcriptional regulator